MILGFKSRFKGKIINGQKIHTIRKDKHGRWKPGMKIHFATGVRTRFYNQFWYGYCKSVQKIEILWTHKFGLMVDIDGNLFAGKGLEEIAKNDGFDNVHEFIVWFLPKPGVFEGKLIHWTNKIY